MTHCGSISVAALDDGTAIFRVRAAGRIHTFQLSAQERADMARLLGGDS